VGKLKRRKPCLFQMRFCGAFDVRETEESLEERRHVFDALGMDNFIKTLVFGIMGSFVNLLLNVVDFVVSFHFP